MIAVFSRVRLNPTRQSLIRSRGARALAALFVAAGCFMGGAQLAWAQPKPAPDPKPEPPKTVTSDDDIDPAKVAKEAARKILVDDALSTPYQNVDDVDAAISSFIEKDFDDARKSLQKAKVANPKLPPAGIMMAKLLFLTQAQQAIQFGVAELEQTITTDPNDPEAYLTLADILFQQRQITASDLMFRKGWELTKDLKKKEPDLKRVKSFEIKVWAGSAAVAEAKKDWDLAKTSITNWIRLDPESAVAPLRLGRVLVKSDKADIEGALRAFKDAEASTNLAYSKKKENENLPRGTDPNIVLAQLYLEAMGERDDKLSPSEQEKKIGDLRKKAVAAAAAGVRVKGTEFDTLLQAAQIALQSKSLKEATDWASEAAKNEKDKNVAQAKFLKAICLRMQGNLKESEALLNDLRAQAPADFNVTNQLALVMVDSTGDSKDDASVKKRKIALDYAATNYNNNQKSAEAVTTLAWCVYRNGDVNKAMQLMQEVARQTQLQPDSAYYVAAMLSDVAKTKSGDEKKALRDNAKKILADTKKADAPFFIHENDAKKLASSL